MQIRKINLTKTNNISPSNKTKVDSDFSSALDLANKEQTEGQLQKLLNEIDILGKRLIATRSLEDAKRYKLKVQEYLSFVIKNAYILKREIGPYNYGIHIKIEVINSKIDELTRELIESQKDIINLADRIEEIKGLLIDVYK
ncbi:YaaR family protein [Caloramator sp. Dgby_cultured_2]|uniref:YaaR family protein n=1 Tax=Caloramator sp. Dgby_cultured_2 TaxID=3029174 RepID=UPI00237D4C92|nr:YaaR family protein [Caloramator sp. Dgby_cultured_2]WDU83898.1 YaaR family protein [Caloramator sp. Dgby_cultured_2]